MITRLTFFLLLIYSGLALSAQPTQPTGLTATGYDRHVELRWDISAEPGLSGYNIYRAEPGGEFTFVKFITSINRSYIDFIGQSDRTFDYRISAKNTSGAEGEFSATATAATFTATDEQLLDMVQEYTFRYFWDFAHPVSGLARERNTTGTVTIGGSGFGIMAILVGIERGFITYEQGLQRLTKIVNFLETADRFHGAYPHWMNGATGNTIPFSQFDDGADLVETAFLIQGLLTVREYIDGNGTQETVLRQKITQIWEGVEWNWFRKGVQNVLYWHWSPNFGWQINLPLRGFNETHIVYILAAASPTYAIPPNLYTQGWAGGNYVNGNTYYGYPLPVGTERGGPLFFAHYSYLGFDPRYVRDQFTNYYNQNVYQTLINRAWCIDNPENHPGYGPDSWGLTAGDDPFGYLAHEPTLARDNGTINPTAALSSMPYTPNQSLAALKHFYRDLGADLWGEYGFYDGFNIGQNWFATSYLAIDQGPIIDMIENHRSQLLWNNFMANPEITDALTLLGFVPDSNLVSRTPDIDNQAFALNISPNPAVSKISINFDLPAATAVQLTLTNASGQLVKSFAPLSFPAGPGRRHFDLGGLPAGVYFLRFQADGVAVVRRIVVAR